VGLPLDCIASIFAGFVLFDADALIPAGYAEGIGERPPDAGKFIRSRQPGQPGAVEFALAFRHQDLRHLVESHPPGGVLWAGSVAIFIGKGAATWDRKEGV